MTAELWPAEPLPAETVAAVQASVGQLVEGILGAVAAENPAYAEVLRGPEGMGLRLGAEQAISAFLDAVARGERPGGQTAEVWRRLGEAEFQSGRSLDALRAAFRTGIRAAWRGAAEVAGEAGVSASAVVALAEAIFLYSDELASDVVEGYLRMQSDEAGERERRRRRLIALLLEDQPDPESLDHAAELARWPLPAGVAVVALEGEAARTVGRRLDLDVLVGPDHLVVPDPNGPGRRERLAQALYGAGALGALGPVVAPKEARRSLEWARLALEAAGRGMLPAEVPVVVERHLPQLLLLADERLAGALQTRALAPLEATDPAERDRLLATLRSWLDHQRHTPAIAAELHVHPQTVRYRMGRLRELLGEALETADGRFELALALRVRETLGRD